MVGEVVNYMTLKRLNFWSDQKEKLMLNLNILANLAFHINARRCRIFPPFLLLFEDFWFCPFTKTFYLRFHARDVCFWTTAFIFPSCLGGEVSARGVVNWLRTSAVH